MTLDLLFRAVLDRGGSSLHLRSGAPPLARVDGLLERFDLPDLGPDDVKQLSYSKLTDVQRAQFERTWELDVGFGVQGIGRVRCNLFKQTGTVAAVFRLIPDTVPRLEDLGLPSVLATLADRPRGLVLVTGPTGSGKSTTLAAMIDRINTSRRVHILTIEDPIEFLHPLKRAVVSQRELHADTHGVAAALRAALREDPDVVLVGEMRDLETIEAALTLAETGHLTMATLHTNSAPQTIIRIVDAFPAHQQSQVRTELSMVLEGVVCQTLLPKAQGRGRVAALEILVSTPAIRHLIREDKLHQIYGSMQAGQDRFGMQTMNQSLARLVCGRAITREGA